MLQILSKTGEVKAELKKFTYTGNFMSESFLSCNIESPSPIKWEIGDYAVYREERFELNYIPAAQKQARKNTYGESFVYNGFKLNSLSDELVRCDFLDYVVADNMAHFSGNNEVQFYGSVYDLAEHIQVNLDRIYTGDNKWTIAVKEGLDRTPKQITISRQNCWNVLVLANTTFGFNFVSKNRHIDIGTSGMSIGKVFGYGKGKGLYDIKQQTDENALLVTRIRAIGSTKNMPYRYYNNLRDEQGNPYIPEAMYVPNLMLPAFPYNGGIDTYIDSENINKLGIREYTVRFDGGDNDLPEIYPSMEGMTAEQLEAAGITINLAPGDNGHLDEIFSADNPTDNGILPAPGEPELPGDFVVHIKDVGFDLNDVLIAGQTPILSMKSGLCAGREFEIMKCEKDGINYKLKCKRFVDDSISMAFPNSFYQIKPGDVFVFLNISMPGVYIQAAAQKMQTATIDFLSKNDYTKFQYTPSIDEKFMAENPYIGFNLKEGDIFNFNDTDLDIEGDVIIQTLNIEENGSPTPIYKVTLANDKIASTIDRIQDSINSLMTNPTGVSIDQVKGLIEAWGNTFFISKQYNDVAAGKITFQQSIEVLIETKTKDLVVRELAKMYDMEVSHLAKVVDMIFENYISTPTFIPGFDGQGSKWYKDEFGNWNLEVDNITVRKAMNVFELIVQKIRSVNGAMVISQANGKIADVAIDGDYYAITTEETYETFQPNDLIRCQVFKGNNIKYYWVEVASIDGNTFRSRISEFAGVAPEIGDEIVQMGNTVNPKRQSLIYLSAAEDGRPVIDILEGVNQKNFNDRLKVRLGNLNDITDSDFPADFQPSGDGLYATNAFLKGIFMLRNGKTIEDQISTEIGSIQVGGRNLALDTNQGVKGWSVEQTVTGQTLVGVAGFGRLILAVERNASTSEPCTLIYDPINYESIKEGSQYTISFDVYPAQNTKLTITPMQFGSTSITAGIWNHVELTCPVLTAAPGNIDLSFKFDTFNSGTLKIGNLKLEEGNKATSWTPAPEDVDARITETETKVETELSAIPGKITASIKEISVTKEDFANSVTGANNLFLNTKKMDKASDWDTISGVNFKYAIVNGFQVASITSNNGYLWQSGKFEKGKTYTVTCYLRREVVLETGPSLMYASVFAANGVSRATTLYQNIANDETVPTSWTRFVWTFRNDSDNSDPITPILKFRCADSSKHPGILIYGYMVVEGDKATSWSPAATDLDVTGRNLVWPSETAKAAAGSDINSWIWFLLTVDIEPNTDYVVSFDKVERKAGTATAFTVALYNENASTFWGANDIPISATPSSAVIHTNASATGKARLLLYAGVAGSTNGNTLEWTHIKLEKGSIPTGWSVAPEESIATTDELTEKIKTTDTKLELVPGQITAAVNTSKEYTNGQVSTLRGELQVTDKKVSAVVSDITAMGKRVSANEAQLTVQAGQIQQTVTKTEYNNSVTGSLNLFRDTRKVSDASIWNYNSGASKYSVINGFQVMKITTRWGRVWQRGIFAPGKTYTVTAWIKRDTSLETGTTMIGYYGDNFEQTIYTSIPHGSVVPTEWTMMIYTFKTLSGMTADNVPRVEFYSAENTIPCGLIYGYMVVEGNKAAAWAPSPEDIEITGRNLVWPSETAKAAAGSDINSWIWFLLTVDIEPNTDYVVSFDKVERKAGTATAFTVALYNENASTFWGANDIPISATPSSAVIHTNASATGKARLLLYAGVAGSTNGNTLEWTHIKLEKGSIPTGWSFAPEESIDTTTKLNTKLTQTADSISAVATRVSGLETSSAGWITKAEGNTWWASKSLENGQNIISYINQTAGSITINANRVKLQGAVSFSMLSDYSSVNSRINGKATMSDVNNALANYVTNSSLNSKLNNYVLATTLSNYVQSSTLTNTLKSYATQTFANNAATTAANSAATAEFNKLKNALVNGTTSIIGGFISTSIIDVDTLYVTRLRGATGSFKSLDCLNASGTKVGGISFGSDGAMWFSGNMYHQGGYRFYTGDIWCRSGIGARRINTLISAYSITYGFYCVDGPNQAGEPGDTSKYVKVVFPYRTSNTGAYYDVPLDASTSTSIPGFTANVFVIQHGNTGTVRYNLVGSNGQIVFVINTHNSYTRYVASNGQWIEIHGGECAIFYKIHYGYLIPSISSSLVGAGWLCVAKYDNGW